MKITGEVHSGLCSAEFISQWSYNPEDPLFVRVAFRMSGEEAEVVWEFSLEMLQEALTNSSGETHGTGDVQIVVVGQDAYITLSTGPEKAVLVLDADEIREFLNQVGEVDTSEAITQKLEEFLETL